MYPQQFQAPFTSQGAWGTTPFAQQGLNLNDVVNVVSRILPLLQLQASQQTPQTGMFGLPQQFASQGQFNPTGQIGSPFQTGAVSPFQTGAGMGQGGGFGYQQSSPQGTNLLEIVNAVARVLPILQQHALQQPFGQGQQAQPFGLGQQFGQGQPFGQSQQFGQGQQGLGLGMGLPQQQFGAQNINPEIVSVISRILPLLGSQVNPLSQTGVPGFGSLGNPYIH
jgi:hypothetical protein